MTESSIKSLVAVAESVGPAHLDRLCDQLADIVVDRVLQEDPSGYAAVNVVISQGTLLVTGQTSVALQPQEMETCFREWFAQLDPENPPEFQQFLWQVKAGHPPLQGTTDMTVCKGYACNTPPHYLPVAFALARKIARSLCTAASFGSFGKVMVQSAPLRHVSLTLPKPSPTEAIENDLHTQLLRIIAENEPYTFDVNYLSNATLQSRFLRNTGLTGRKIVHDNYGPSVPVSGGAYSGKSPHHVDRCGNYMARHVAKNIVAAGLAEECQITAVYSNSTVPQIYCKLDGKKASEAFIDQLAQTFDWRSEAIARFLHLEQPHYLAATYHGHYGAMDCAFPWERVEKYALAL